MYLLRNFLKDPEKYAKAEKLWTLTFLRVVKQLGQEKKWKVPWFKNEFANGTPIRDANPMFTAVDRSRRLAVRIIQTPYTADGEPDLIHWTDTFGKGDPEELEELVISCVLSDETIAKATDLMTKWAKDGLLDDSVRPQRAGRVPRTPIPRRHGMPRA